MCCLVVFTRLLLLRLSFSVHNSCLYLLFFISCGSSIHNHHHSVRRVFIMHMFSFSFHFFPFDFCLLPLAVVFVVGHGFGHIIRSIWSFFRFFPLFSTLTSASFHLLRLDFGADFFFLSLSKQICFVPFFHFLFLFSMCNIYCAFQQTNFSINN